ncbi:hypothetical protein CORMATOL_02123 [Corynebacterium matruchotii ATCC 33806]|uniref:Uncharacterized protein n=1 Tax=Corynebacterium matruchotii ATCC 33806 TaxID=566549 RepID=C0E548_9CORY|nr:hypothetical protein CORMATOL_02123 [Corynebacterium matruchotii ATCC 33806]
MIECFPGQAINVEIHRVYQEDGQEFRHCVELDNHDPGSKNRQRDEGA